MVSADCADERTSMPVRKGPSAASALARAASPFLSSACASRTKMRQSARSPGSRVSAAASARRRCRASPCSTRRPMARPMAPCGFFARRPAASRQAPSASSASRSARAVTSSCCSVGCSSPNGSACSSTSEIRCSRRASSCLWPSKSFLLPWHSFTALCMPLTVASTASRRATSFESCVWKDGDVLFLGSCCFFSAAARAAVQTFVSGATHFVTSALTSFSIFAAAVSKLSCANGSAALTIFVASASALATASITSVICSFVLRAKVSIFSCVSFSTTASTRACSCCRSLVVCSRRMPSGSCRASTSCSMTVVFAASTAGMASLASASAATSAGLAFASGSTSWPACQGASASLIRTSQASARSAARFAWPANDWPASWPRSSRARPWSSSSFTCAARARAWIPASRSWSAPVMPLLFCSATFSALASPAWAGTSAVSTDFMSSSEVSDSSNALPAPSMSASSFATLLERPSSSILAFSCWSKSALTRLYGFNFFCESISRLRRGAISAKVSFCLSSERSRAALIWASSRVRAPEIASWAASAAIWVSSMALWISSPYSSPNCSAISICFRRHSRSPASSMTASTAASAWSTDSMASGSAPSAASTSRSSRACCCSFATWRLASASS
mmetsp:Transcript_48804/g.139633  ORF Transcript_48804/g.139633 Transcript_48804/m.139633 type:complete len:627 (+) Transcript_48804:436-2316(+)